MTRAATVLILLGTLPLAGSTQHTAYVHPEDALAAGDVDRTSVVLWVRGSVAGPARLEVAREMGDVVARREVRVPGIDVPGKVEIDGLAPGTRYRATAVLASGTTVRARFRTPAAEGVHAGLRFGASGDWSGDLRPYSAVRNAKDRDLDFFAGVGDSVYADIRSPAVPVAQARSLAEHRAKHAEVYSDVAGLNPLGDLRAATATFATIDDHEIGDNFWGDAVNDAPLFENALRAFHEWNPIREQRWADTGHAEVDGEWDLYRVRTFGADAVLIVLDTRSFRSEPLDRPGRDPTAVAAFRAAAFRPGRTVLGVPQRDRFERDLRVAQAAGVTWKFVVVPTPIQNLGPGQDRYEGYAHERSRILALIHDEGIRNVVFVTGDIHGMAVNDLRYQRSSTSDPQVEVGAFEVATLPIGCHGVLGRYTVAAADLSGAERRAYEAADMDGQDDVLVRVLDERLAREGLGRIGLDDSGLAARLVEGKWARGHAYGWCEFEVDAVTQRLTVTAWGVPVDPPTEVALKASRVPRVLARFWVDPR